MKVKIGSLDTGYDIVLCRGSEFGNFVIEAPFPGQKTVLPDTQAGEVSGAREPARYRMPRGNVAIQGVAEGANGI